MAWELPLNKTVLFLFFRKEKLTQCYMAVILQFFKRLNFKDF